MYRYCKSVCTTANKDFC